MRVAFHANERFCDTVSTLPTHMGFGSPIIELLNDLYRHIDKVRAVKMIWTLTSEAFVQAALSAPVQSNEMSFNALANQARC